MKRQSPCVCESQRNNINFLFQRLTGMWKWDGDGPLRPSEACPLKDHFRYSPQIFIVIWSASFKERWAPTLVLHACAPTPPLSISDTQMAENSQPWEKTWCLLFTPLCSRKTKPRLHDAGGWGAPPQFPASAGDPRTDTWTHLTAIKLRFSLISILIKTVSHQLSLN